MVAAFAFPGGALAARTPDTVHRQFRSEGRFTDVATNGREIAFVLSPNAIRLRRSNQTDVTITTPCSVNPYAPMQLGRSYLMLDCGRQVALYGLADGRWRTVAIAPTSDCAAASDCTLQPVSVGARWLMVSEEWDCMLHGCANATEYVDILTGQLAPANAAAAIRPGGDQTLDLDSPTLTRTLCRPLREPAGAVFPDGRFTLAETFTQSQYQAALVTVERCGSRHRLRFGPLGAWAANSSVIVWDAAGPGHAFSGARLATGRRFRLPVSRPLRRLKSWSFYLTDQRLYLVDSDSGRTWSAPAPR